MSPPQAISPHASPAASTSARQPLGVPSKNFSASSHGSAATQLHCAAVAIAHADGISKPSMQSAVHWSTGPAEPGEHVSQTMHTVPHAATSPSLLVSSPVSLVPLVLVDVAVAVAVMVAELALVGGAVGSGLVALPLVVGVPSVAEVTSAPSPSPTDDPVSPMSADFGAQARSTLKGTKSWINRISPAYQSRCGVRSGRASDLTPGLASPGSLRYGSAARGLQSPGIPAT